MSRFLDMVDEPAHIKKLTLPQKTQLAEEIRHVLAGLFERRDFRDPELGEAIVTVTEVRVGPDLKHAIAFVSRLGRSDVDALLPALMFTTTPPSPDTTIACPEPSGPPLPPVG